MDLRRYYKLGYIQYIKELLKLYTGAYDVIFSYAAGPKEDLITFIPRYSLGENFKVGDIISMSSFSKRTRKRFFNFLGGDSHRIKEVEYYCFPKWQFWRKDKYVHTYRLEE